MTAVLLLLVTGISLGVSPRRAPRQSRTLPDGSVVTLEALTFQQPHRFSNRGRVGQLFGPYLPPSAQQATGIFAESLPYIDPQVPVAWISWKRPATPFGPIYDWMVYDADGCESQLGGEFNWGGGADTKNYSSQALYAYPRWGRPWGLRLYELQFNAAAKRVADFPLPQIGQTGRSDEATPTPRLTARDGDLEFALRRFATGCSWESDTVPPKYGDPVERSTHLEIAATQSGRPTQDWMPVSFQLSDKNGNLLSAGAEVNPVQKGNVTQLRLRKNLFAEQRSWRVRVEVARSPSARFRPEEVVVIRNVPTPSRSDPSYQSPWLNAPRSLGANGMTLNCRGMRWGPLGPPYAEVTMELKGQPRAGTRITILKAVDASGRTVPLVSGSEVDEFNWLEPPAVWHRLRLAIQRPTKTVDLTVAVQRTKFIEFQASPTRPTGPVPTSLQAVTSR